MKILQESIAKACLGLAILLVAATPVKASTVGVTTQTVTNDATIRAGARQLILVFSSDFTGTLDGVDYTWAAGGSVNFGPYPYDTIAAIAYVTTTGSITIIAVR